MKSESVGYLQKGLFKKNIQSMNETNQSLKQLLVYVIQNHHEQLPDRVTFELNQSIKHLDNLVIFFNMMQENVK
jgi:hypothetical protein